MNIILPYLCSLPPRPLFDAVFFPYGVVRIARWLRFVLVLLVVMFGAGLSSAWATYNVTITNATESSGGSWSENIWIATAENANVAASEIVDRLNDGLSVTISTGSGGGQDGDITVDTPISKTSGGIATLALTANRNITIKQSQIISGASGHALNLILAARTNAGGDETILGHVKIDANIRTFGGNVTIGGGDGQASGFAIAADTWMHANAGGVLNSRDFGSNIIIDATGDGTGSADTNIPTAPTGGNIVIRGKGNTTATQANWGVGLKFGSVITGGNGVIDIEGHGGNGANYFWSVASVGVAIEDRAYIKAKDGNVLIKGIQGTGFDQYGIASTGSNKLIGSNGYVLFDGDSLLVRDNTLTLYTGSSSDVKAPIVGSTGPGGAAFTLSKSGSGTLNLWGDAQAWDANAVNTYGTNKNNTFTDTTGFVNIVSPTTADQALYVFSTQPSATQVDDSTSDYFVHPTTPANNITSLNITNTSVVINWTPGNGINRMVLIKAGSAVNSTLVDNTTYTANAEFGSGSQIGDDNYVVYNGNGESVTVTGLTAETTYYVAIFEFNGTGGAEKYLTDSANFSFSLPSVVNGVCGTAHGETFTSAPATNLCSSGTASSVTSNNSTYAWACSANGGTEASCLATRHYLVTPSVSGGNGSIDPNTVQQVAYSATPSFTLTPESGYSASVGGSCGGSLSGNTYIIDNVTEHCTVETSFSLLGYTVTASAGIGGSIDPISRTVTHGATTSFTVEPDTGYSITDVTGCDGSLGGNTYTTGVITEACTVTVSFNPITYTIAYDANGGSGSMDTTSHTYDEAKSLPANNFTRTSYAFTGWNTQADGNGTSYIDEQSVTNLADTQDATITLYAQWSANDYTINTDPTNNIRADGNAFSTLTITAKTASNVPIEGEAIFLAITAGDAGSGGLNTASLTTDADGKATTTLTSTNATALTVTGYLGTDASGTEIGTVTVYFVPGYALEFNGISDYVEFGAQSPPYNNASLTIEAWVKIPVDTLADSNPIVVWESSSTTSNVQFRSSAGKLELGVDDGIEGWSAVTSSTRIDTGDWVHVAVVKNGAHVTLYINGVAEGSDMIHRNALVDRMYLGRFVDSSTPYHFLGAMDEVRIWNTARTAEQIADNKDRTLTGDEFGLVAYYSMEDGGGTTLGDGDSANDYPGTLHGVQWVGGVATDAPLPTYTVTYNANTATAGTEPTDDNLYQQHDSVVILGNTGNLSKTDHNFSGWNTQAEGEGTAYQVDQTLAMGTANVTLYAQWALNQYTVTTSAGTGGGIDPTNQTVTHGETATFTITPETGYNHSETISGDCPEGSWNNTEYTTGAITANCTVSFSFTLIPPTPVNGQCGSAQGQTFTSAPATNLCSSGTASSVTSNNSTYIWACSGAHGGTQANCSATRHYLVTPSVSGGNGSMNPDSVQQVAYNATPSFTVNPASGYSASVGGSCGGTLDEMTYTTHAITTNCTVEAGFTLNTYTVTPVTGEHGNISPDTPQTVDHGQVLSFTLTPDSGYNITSISGCGGQLSGNTYSTSAITEDCTIEAQFGSDAPPQANVDLSGDALLGETLTGTYAYTDAESDSEDTSASGSQYQWYRGTEADHAQAQPIVDAHGATQGLAQTYTLSAADAGQYLFYCVTPKALSGTVYGMESCAEAIGPIQPGILQAVEVTLSNAQASAEAVSYTLSYTTTHAVRANDALLDVEFPVGVILPTFDTLEQCGNILNLYLNETEQVLSEQLSACERRDDHHLVVWTTHAIAGGTSVRIELNGVTNPVQAGQAFFARFGTATQTGYAIEEPATPLSLTYTPAVSVPDAPTGLSANAGNGQVSLSWIAPSNDGGSAITGYMVTGSPNGSCTTTGATTCTVTGLSNGASYSFTVVAINVVGNSPVSNTAMATPVAPPINGQCGSAHGQTFTSAPATNLCSSGTASSVTSNNSTYIWACSGAHGGTQDNCSATRHYLVTPSVSGGNGSMNPDSVQQVAYNATPSFTVNPASGYSASVGGSCGGILDGTSYTVNSVTQHCTIEASFISQNLAPVASDVGIAGTPQAGETLTGEYTYTDAEDDAESGTTFRWLRHTSDAYADATAIPGAETKTYIIVSADLGQYLFFCVTPRADIGLTLGDEACSNGMMISTEFALPELPTKINTVACIHQVSGMPITTPMDQFVIHNDGTLTHTPTGLMWMRCSMGQRWDGNTCVGSSNAYHWASALRVAARQRFANYTNWRVPNRHELMSIIEESCWDPAINATIFPNIPSWVFWSSSPSALSLDRAWGVNFATGEADTYDMHTLKQLLLVRDEQVVNEYESLIAGRCRAINNGNIIIDFESNLEWQRCAVGQTWNQAQNTCEGPASGFTWHEARGLGSNGFRLPSEGELETLALCFNNTPSAFNNTPTIFWSATTKQSLVYGYAPERAAYIDFNAIENPNFMLGNMFYKNQRFPVLLVRQR